MKNQRLRSGVRFLAVIAATASGGGLGAVALSSSAHADPAYNPNANPVVGVGANTEQDLFDAYTGLAPSAGISLQGNTTTHVEYPPLADPTTHDQIYYFDSVNPYTLATGDCITSRPGSSSFSRPNGTGNGLKAISDEVEGDTWQSTAGSCGPQSVAGDISFATAASPPATGTGTNQLSWVDFGHDAVTYAYYGNGLTTAQKATIADLSTANETTLYGSASGTATFGSGASAVTVFACLPQSGSGTETFFLQAIGVSQSTAGAAATSAGCFGPTNNGIEENGANAFYTAATTEADGTGIPSGDAAIIAFSVGSWISQANGAAQDRSFTGRNAGVDLGDTDGAGEPDGPKPYTGTPGSEVANPDYEASTTWGRDLYAIVPYAALNGRGSSTSAPEQAIFGTASNPGTGQICQAPFHTTELAAFGFVSSSAPCGTETQTGATVGNGST